MGIPEGSIIIWTGYMKHRAELRGFEFSKIENILRPSAEKHLDTATQRLILVGKHDNILVIIP